MSLSIPDMILKIKRRATIPVFDALFTNDLILDALNDELKETTYPDYINLHTGTALQVIELPLQTNGSDNYPTGLIPYPRRCYGTLIKKAYYKTTGGIISDLSLLSENQLDVYQFTNISSKSAVLYGIFPQNDFIRLIPTQKDNQGSIQIWYVTKVPTLVNDPNIFGQIQNFLPIDSMNLLPKLITDQYSFIDTYCPIDSNNYFDIYRKSTGSILYPDVLLKRTTDSSTSVNYFEFLSSFSNDQIQELKNCQLGGFPLNFYTPADLLLMPADQNYFTPINNEIDDYLAVKTGARLLTSQGIGEESTQLNMDADKIWQKIMPLFAERVVDNVKVVKPRRGIRAYTTGYNLGWWK